MFLFYVSSFAVFLSDQYIKHRIRKDTGLPRSMGHNLILRNSKNRGMFLNLLQNHPRLVSALTGAALVLLSFFTFFTCRKESSLLLKLAFGLMLGGGASNVYDHLRHGYVTDYISFARPARFRHIVYNLADFAIFLSIILVGAAQAKQ